MLFHNLKKIVSSRVQMFQLTSLFDRNETYKNIDCNVDTITQNITYISTSET